MITKYLFFFVFNLFLITNILAQETGIFETSFSWTNETIGNQTRQMYLSVPNDYNSSDSYTLIIAFTGLGDHPYNYVTNINYMVTDDYYGGNVIIASPYDGPNDSEDLGSTSYFYTPGEDDGIVPAVINAVSQNYNINHEQVYIQGFSMGGKSALMHGLRHHDLLAGMFLFTPAFVDSYDIKNIPGTPNNDYGVSYDYENASQIPACYIVGAQDYYSQNPDTPYVALVEIGFNWYENQGGNGLFFKIPGMLHTLPAQTYVRQCWDFFQENNTSKQKIQANNENLIIYPNPSSGIFNIEINNISKIEIINIAGKTAFVYDNTNKSKKTSIDLSHLSSGVYFANISTKNNIITKKIILQ